MPENLDALAYYANAIAHLDGASPAPTATATASGIGPARAIAAPR